MTTDANGYDSDVVLLEDDEVIFIGPYPEQQQTNPQEQPSAISDPASTSASTPVTVSSATLAPLNRSTCCIFVKRGRLTLNSGNQSVKREAPGTSNSKMMKRSSLTTKETVQLQCPECGMSFETHMLSDHRWKVHKKLQFDCLVCGADFEYSTQLGNHKSREHPNGPFKCLKCDSSKSYAGYDTLKQHNRNFHLMGEHRCTVDECTFRASTLNEVAKHQYQNHRPPVDAQMPSHSGANDGSSMPSTSHQANRQPATSGSVFQEQPQSEAVPTQAQADPTVLQLSNVIITTESPLAKSTIQQAAQQSGSFQCTWPYYANEPTTEITCGYSADQHTVLSHIRVKHFKEMAIFLKGQFQTKADICDPHLYVRLQKQ